MMPNYYIQDRLAQAHRQELLREAEQQRLVAQLPRAGYKVWLLSRLSSLWLTLRTGVRKHFLRRID